MDQLHEELKQPCVVDLSFCNKSNSSSEDEDDVSRQKHHMGKLETIPVPVHGEARETATVATEASQSDTEYETCDSGMSSERSSMEHNAANAEEDHGKDGARQRGNSYSSNDSTSPILNRDSENAGRGSVSRNAAPNSPSEARDSDSGLDTISINTAGDTNQSSETTSGAVISSSKDIQTKDQKTRKNTANLASRRQKHGQKTSESADTGTRSGEEVEYSDAASDADNVSTGGRAKRTGAEPSSPILIEKNKPRVAPQTRVPGPSVSPQYRGSFKKGEMSWVWSILF